MKVTMSAEFTDEQFKYFAERMGWNEEEYEESYIDFAKRICLENMRNLVSIPLRKSLLKQAEADVEAAIEVIKTSVTLEA